MQDYTAIIQLHQMMLTSNLWMLAKTAVMMEGLGLKLDPDYDFFSVSEPIAAVSSERNSCYNLVYKQPLSFKPAGSDGPRAGTK
jgi:predicted unusual protein kinase regulating ubiquinone biosynthesis (AarF/ABC1/UbiB family)